MAGWSDITGEILEERGAARFYSSVLFRQSTDSSNEWLKELGEKNWPEGTVGIAEEQTAGKGRLGRKWVSPAGANIYFSLLLRPSFAPENASAMTLVMGLSVAQAIRDVTGLAASIKWPNDIVINRRKVCGILTEMKAEPGKIDYVVIGTGINVNQVEFEEDILKFATSLKLEKMRTELREVGEPECEPAGSGGMGDSRPGRNMTADDEPENSAADRPNDIDRSILLAQVLLRFRDNYDRYCLTGDVSLLVDDYNRLLVNCGRQVRIEDPRGAYAAVSRGITGKGGLLVELQDGEIREITGGEVSVRGLYGYV